MLIGSGSAGRRGRLRRLRPGRRPTRTCTAPWSAGWSRSSVPSWVAGCGPGRSRNDQIATLIRMYLRDALRAGGGRGRRTWSPPCTSRPSAHLGVAMPGRTHLQHAQPILLSHHLLAHAWPLLRDVRADRATSTAGWPSARTDRPRWPAPRSGWTRGAWPPSWASTASVANSIDGTAARDLVAEAAYVLAQIGVDLSRLSEDVILWVTHEFGFATPGRRLVDRVEHHAAEEEPRRRRAGPRQGRPADRQPHRAAGHPARVCRWPTTGTCRRTRSRSSTRSTSCWCCCRRWPGWSPP